MTTQTLVLLGLVAYFILIAIILITYFAVQSVKKAIQEETEDYSRMDNALLQIQQLTGVSEACLAYDNVNGGSNYIVISCAGEYNYQVRTESYNILASYDVLYTYLNQHNTPNPFKRYDIVIQYC